jgi:hypothetical protein
MHARSRTSFAQFSSSHHDFLLSCLDGSKGRLEPIEREFCKFVRSLNLGLIVVLTKVDELTLKALPVLRDAMCRDGWVDDAKHLVYVSLDPNPRPGGMMPPISCWAHHPGTEISDDGLRYSCLNVPVPCSGPLTKGPFGVDELCALTASLLPGADRLAWFAAQSKAEPKLPQAVATIVDHRGFLPLLFFLRRTWRATESDRERQRARERGVPIVVRHNHSYLFVFLKQSLNCADRTASYPELNAFELHDHACGNSLAWPIFLFGRSFC